VNEKEKLAITAKHKTARAITITEGVFRLRNMNFSMGRSPIILKRDEQRTRRRARRKAYQVRNQEVSFRKAAPSKGNEIFRRRRDRVATPDLLTRSRRMGIKGIKREGGAAKSFHVPGGDVGTNKRDFQKKGLANIQPKNYSYLQREDTPPWYTASQHFNSKIGGSAQGVARHSIRRSFGFVEYQGV